MVAGSAGAGAGVSGRRPARLHLTGRRHLRAAGQRVRPVRRRCADAALLLDKTTGDEPGSATLRAFLDVFNHRLYVLLYKAWRLEHPLAERPDSVYRANLAAIGGRMADADVPSSAGLSGRRVRSAAGLRNLVRSLLPGLDVEVFDRVPQWVEMDNNVGLGQGIALGGESLLGDAMVVAGGRVRIEVGTLEAKDAKALLPQQKEGQRLLGAVSAYLDRSREFEIVLKVQAEAGSGRRLGEEGLRLGWSTWLGDGSAYTYDIRLSGDQAGNNQNGAAASETLANAA
ncbi:hypothetical protein CAI21_08480 [Alkalilimnicola ehrlichii]|nr:hypothetical protein CAI21_08480 [Alkalilimnicola ehrlichii]